MLPWCSPAVLYAGSALALRRFRYQCILVKRYKPRCVVPLVSYQLLLVNTGILVCFIAGMYLDWRKISRYSALLYRYRFMILMFRDSPRLLDGIVSKGKTKRARKSLQWLRGKGTDITGRTVLRSKSLHTESERNVSQGGIHATV